MHTLKLLRSISSPNNRENSTQDHLQNTTKRTLATNAKNPSKYNNSGEFACVQVINYLF